MRHIDDETDMAALEAAVRGIEKDGLVWGASKLVPVGFGIKKLQINLVIEDEKISLSDLEEEIQGFEDYVQSTDVVSFQIAIKIRSSYINQIIGRHAEAVNNYLRWKTTFLHQHSMHDTRLESHKGWPMIAMRLDG